METRANFILIGAFTLAGILGALGFFVWLAKIEIDRQYDYYDVLFDSVSGLGRAGEVRFNGLLVGQVTLLRLSQTDPGKVRVRLEVTADTPVTTETRAQLQVQGVTGVSFVSLSGGGEDKAQRLRDVSDDPIPLIPSERSVVQALTEDAPNLIAQAQSLLENLTDLTGADTRTFVTSILSNLDTASGQLEQALADFSSISQSVASATDEISVFTSRLDGIGNAVETTLGVIDTTLTDAQSALAQAEGTFQAATGAMGSVETTFDSARGVIDTQVSGIVADVAEASATMRAAVDELRGQVGTVLSQYGDTADLASARLRELEVTLDNLDATLAEADVALESVDSAAVEFETLLEGEGAALVADARAAFATLEQSMAGLNRVVDQDVPTLIGDISDAVRTAGTVISEVGQDVTGLSGRLDPLAGQAETALSAATVTLQDAGRTLAQVDSTLTEASRALVAAESALTSADTVIREEAAPTAAEIRDAAQAFALATTSVAEDLPAITGELRATLAQASDVVARIDRAVAEAAPGVAGFATSGLGQIDQFAREARGLISSLDSLVRRIERDPARFFLGNQPPTYRR